MSSSTPSVDELGGGLARLLTCNVNEANRSTALVRKADMAYNHVEFAARPGLCRVSSRKMDIKANFLKIKLPPKLQAFAYRIELSMNREPVIKRDKAEPLFWSLYQHLRAQRSPLFPRSLNAVVFDGVCTIYSLEPLNIPEDGNTINFPVQPARVGARRPPRMARATIIPIPMVNTTDFFSDDEAVRTQMVMLMDLIISQEMRNPLIASASRFIIQGHSLFKVPTTDREKKLCARGIGMGEEVWNGLHMAVKADSPDDIFLNVNTSSSLFYTPKLNLVTFYSEVIHGYSLEKVEESNCDRLTIDHPSITKLVEILKGTKVRYLNTKGDYTVKKFYSIHYTPANKEEFEIEETGQRLTVAEYYLKQRNIRLKFPNLPCLVFEYKSGGSYSIPMELCTTSEEPRKFKGRLTDMQLNTFIKVAGMKPEEKKHLIETLVSPAGSYLGRGDLMTEWGIGIDRNLTDIKDTTVLPYPDIQWKDRVTRVNEISAEYLMAENEKEPRKLIETGSKPLALVMVFVNGDGCVEYMKPQSDVSVAELQKQVYEKDYRDNTEFFARTLRGYGIEVGGPVSTFQYLLDDRGNMNLQGIDRMIEDYKEQISNAGKTQKKEFIPLFMFVFPRRHDQLYSCLKYKCDVQFGVLSQVLLRRTFQKFEGNSITNSSSQNVLLKVLAKAGGVACRIDGTQYKNVGKMTSSSESTLVLGIDVSHPSREEKLHALAMEGLTSKNAGVANKKRGQHNQLPTAGPAASNLLNMLPYHKRPRSVVAVVGNTDLLQTKWAVSTRVIGVGEEIADLKEPFFARIKDYISKTGMLPKHIIVYRDGVSDSEFKKALYYETEALESALAMCDISSPTEVTITYIIAQKRHHTRFFASDPKQAIDMEGRPGGNTPPGLLVEKTITSRSTFDFYLQSHYGTLGTAVPTHYYVLMDDWQPSVSFWQTIVFAHCFMNARSTRPLSIPVPLHYAHLAAKKAKQAFDHFRQYSAPEEYRTSKEEIVKQDMEMRAITLNDELANIDSMYFA